LVVYDDDLEELSGSRQADRSARPIAARRATPIAV